MVQRVIVTHTPDVRKTQWINIPTGSQSVPTDPSYTVDDDVRMLHADLNGLRSCPRETAGRVRKALPRATPLTVGLIFYCGVGVAKRQARVAHAAPRRLGDTLDDVRLWPSAVCDKVLVR